MIRSGIVIVYFAVAAMGAVELPKVQMNDGREMPALALGTYLGFDKDGIIKSKNKEVREAVVHAIDLGYRHIDTAAIYETEAEVGEAVRMKIDQGVVTRDDMFITTKLWNTKHQREQVVPAVNEVLNKTGLDYIDMYLMHWPIGLNEDYTFSDVDYLETWKGLEDALTLGLVKSIGLSNFNEDQIKRVIAEGTVRPAALQIEISPQNIQKDLLSYCKSENITAMGYSPFGSLVLRFGLNFPGPKANHPLLVGLTEKYGKTSAQIVLRWLVDRNVVPVAKSTNPKRLQENLSIFDFHLQPEEVEEISKFNTNTRFTLPSFWQTHPYYPFEKIENPVANPFKLKVSKPVETDHPLQVQP